MKLSQLGERNIIDLIWRTLGETQEYDDCVTLEQDSNFLLLTVDFIGEKTHFMRDWPMESIGKFFAAINLSDIAAMGGNPTDFMASMFFPSDFYSEDLGAFIRGMKNMLDRYHVTYRGGDLKESQIAGMSGIAIGYVEKDKIIRRKGAHMNDGIFVTGALGKQAGGYFLWKNGHEEGVNILLEVIPRIIEAQLLAGKASSGMDISDGLSASITQMEKINALPFHVDFDAVPVDKLAYEVSEDYGIPLEYLVLDFGGEYELLYTSSTQIIGKEIGVVGERSGIWKNGKKVGGEGYAHFSALLDKT